VIFVGDSRDSERASACGVRDRDAALDATQPAGKRAPAAVDNDFVKALRLSVMNGSSTSRRSQRSITINETRAAQTP
jgi:hypothetical protein